MRGKPDEAVKSAQAAAATARLVSALRDALRSEAGATGVVEIETHISHVLLAGEFAWKIKKPVNLGFLDFTSLESRRRYCEEELRLNRRTAPQLYLAVVPITGTAAAPVPGGAGEPIEYAVKMRRFADDALLDHRARSGLLGVDDADALGDAVATFHSGIARAAAGAAFGTPEHVLAQATQNFDQIDELGIAGEERARLDGLRAWTGTEFERRRDRFASRRAGGFVRECHGDLHLGNIAMIDGRVTPFDAIEFNDDFRWIDVMNEVAFLLMDLFDHRLPGLAWRCLDRYLERTGDHAGLAVLRFYLVYRAMVRAKIAAIRASQERADDPGRARVLAEFAEYVELAERLARPGLRTVVLTRGVSGSGKTTLSTRALESLGMVRVRSDVERKRLLGLDARSPTGSALDAGAYASGVTERTYEALKRAAGDALDAGFAVIVDAAFLKRAQRAPFLSMGVPATIVDCQAPEGMLRERIAARAAAGADASEATSEVLARQIETEELLDERERECALAYQSDGGEAALTAVLAQLAARAGTTGPAPRGG